MIIKQHFFIFVRQVLQVKMGDWRGLNRFVFSGRTSEREEHGWDCCCNGKLYPRKLVCTGNGFYVSQGKYFKGSIGKTHNLHFKGSIGKTHNLHFKESIGKTHNLHFKGSLGQTLKLHLYFSCETLSIYSNFLFFLFFSLFDSLNEMFTQKSSLMNGAGMEILGESHV